MSLQSRPEAPTSSFSWLGCRGPDLVLFVEGFNSNFNHDYNMIVVLYTEMQRNEIRTFKKGISSCQIALF